MMTNRKMLLGLMVFTAIMGFMEGCDNSKGEPPDAFRPSDFGAPKNDLLNPRYCDYGTKPCVNGCIDQDQICTLSSLDDESIAGELDLVLSSEGDYCDDPDVWGCPGNPCVHGACWDGDGWAMGDCRGVVRDREGTIVDPGTCE